MPKADKFRLIVFFTGIILVIIAFIFNYFEFNKFFITLFNTMGAGLIGSCIGSKLTEIL